MLRLSAAPAASPPPAPRCCVAMRSHPREEQHLCPHQEVPLALHAGGNKDDPAPLGGPLAIGPKERRERSGDAKADTSAGGGDKTHMEREGWGGGKEKRGGCISTSTQKEPWADLRGPATGCWARTRFPTLADVSPPLFGSDSSHFRLYTAVCVCWKMPDTFTLFLNRNLDVWRKI